MRLEIEYTYQFTWVPARAINDRVDYARARREVEIPEREASKAPVVMMVGNDPGEGRELFRRKDDGSLREVRFMEGRYFVEVGPAAALARQASENLDATPFKACGAWHLMAGADRGKRLTTLEEVQRRERQPLRRHRDDGGKATGEKLARRAASLAVVDGVLFQPTGEPILRRDPYNRKITVDARPAPSSERHAEFDVYGKYTSGGERFAPLSHPDSMLPADSEGMRCAFEVLDASRSTYDGTARDVAALAESVLATMVQGAHLLDRDALEAMYALRRAVAQLTPEPSEHPYGDEPLRIVTSPLVAALDRVAALPPPEMGLRRAIAARHAASVEERDRWRHRETLAQQMAKDEVPGHVAGAASMAAEGRRRWDARPRDLGWEDRALAVAGFRDDDRRWSRQLLSVGQVRDACEALGIDAEPVLEAVRNGATVLAAGRGASGAPSAVAVVTPGRETTMLGHGDDAHSAYASTIERHLMAAERGVEAAFDLLPIASPGR